MAEVKKLERSVDDKMIAGVCGGLGKYFDLDPVLVRIVFAILALVGGGGLLIYVVLWLVMPEATAAA